MTERLTRVQLTRWTITLRTYPERQYKGKLANEDYTKFCCLGQLAELEGVSHCVVDDEPGYNFVPGCVSYESASSAALHGPLAAMLGSRSGVFAAMSMPDLVHERRVFHDLAEANDCHVPWPVIADHLDEFYPASEG